MSHPYPPPSNGSPSYRPSAPDPFQRMRPGPAPGRGGGDYSVMAGWALGLSLVFCLPFASIVGLILGIVVLARRADDGRKMAIGAVVVGGVVVLAQLGIVVGGVVQGVVDGFDETARDDSGEVVEGGDLSPLKIRVGDCFNDDALSDDDRPGPAESDVVEAVPCSQSHQFEAYHDFDLDGARFPGQRAIKNAVVDGCLPAFKDYVGIPYAKSRLDASFYGPTPQSWELLDDRVITCVIYDPRRDTTAGSFENARR